MQTKQTTFQAIGETVEITIPMTMLLPLAFPLIAWLDGAQVAYQGLGVVFLGLSAVAMVLFAMLLTGIANAFESLADYQREREETAAAFRAFLSSGQYRG